MKIGMIGLGRMGGSMVRRLTAAGHVCVVYSRSAATRDGMVGDGILPAASVQDLISQLPSPRVVWLMIPASAVDAALDGALPWLNAGDTVVDGGNSHHVDDIRRAARTATQGVRYVDVGTSGGVWGLDRGYCLMIGGEPAAVAELTPIFESLAPGTQLTVPTAGREGHPGTADRGYLHCGPAGAGHFVKMVHNGIEYGLMAALAEGFSVLRHANAGALDRAPNAVNPPPPEPENYRYSLDVAEIAELWRRGSVVSSWLLDLTAAALQESPELSGFTGRVPDSGEGRWTVKAAIDESVPVPVLSAALYQRFSSTGASNYADRLLSAMRAAFGGHREAPG